MSGVCQGPEGQGEWTRNTPVLCSASSEHLTYTASDNIGIRTWVGRKSWPVCVVLPQFDYIVKFKVLNASNLLYMSAQSC